MKVHHFTILVILSMLNLVFVSCDIKDNEVAPGLTFTKIYNNPAFSGDYDPLDIQQTSDSGYVVLAASDSWNVYLLKADTEGEFAWELTLPEPYVNPVSSLIEINGAYYFFCMDEITLGTYLMKIDLSGGAPEVVHSYPDITYPLHASLNPDFTMLVQSYNRDARATTLTKLDADFSIDWQNKYDVLDDAEEPIIEHLTRIGERLPFFTGHIEGAGNSGYYFLNGFYNFTLSLMFVRANDGELSGVINGFRDKGGISAATSLSNNSFALSRYDFGDNFFLPLTNIDLNGIGFSGDLEVSDFPELSSNARVILKKLTIQGKEVIIYASDTKSNQLVLYAYDAASEALLDVKYLGQTYPYKIGSFTPTSDGGMAVLGKTFVAGRFPRLAIFKLTIDEVQTLVQE